MMNKDFNSENILYDFVRGFTVDLDQNTGISKKIDTTKRYLSGMKGMYADEEAYEIMLKNSDDLIYEFHSIPAPETEGDFAFGMSIVYPGLVGNEYFMTKGHFHSIIDTGEVYYCLKGEGYMLLENPEGDWSALHLTPGNVVYVPKRYAHRSICTSKHEPLMTYFVYRADAGHDYGTIEEKGYRKLLVKENESPIIKDNPKWKNK